jgi:hypothetical protein
MVTGRMAWEIETTEAGGKGQVVNLWPLVSSALRPYPTTSGLKWFRAYDYGRPDDLKHLNADQVFYAWTPSLTDFRQPESAFMAARIDLSVAVMADRYSYAFLKNGSTPAAMVITREFANKGDRSKFRRQFTHDHAGPDNANKVMFAELEPGQQGDGDVTKSIDVKVLGLSQKDSQFIEQHKHSLAMVAIALGVPWSKLDASGRTYDNATVEDKTWWKESLLPDIKVYQDEVNMGLAERVGREYGWFDLSGVESLRVKPEPTTQSVGAPALYQSMLMTKNEARADYGLPPVPGGDEFITAAELAMLNPAGGDEPIRVISQDAKRDPVAVPVVTPPTRAAAPPETRAPTAEQVEARRARIWSTTDRVATTLEKQWERAFRRLFTRQADSTASRLTGKRGRQAERRDTVDPNSIFDRAFWANATDEVAADLYEAVAAAAGARVADAFGIDFDLENPAMQDLIKARSNQLAGQVTDTTYKQITEALADGAAAGEDTTALAARIREVFADATKNRSVVIARTEVVSAFNGSTAQLAAILPDDVVAGQEWIATRDGRTREAHAAADGQVRRPGEAFSVGGHAMAYPGDPSAPAEETVQCRCTLALLTPEDMAEREADRSRRHPLDTCDGVIALAASTRKFDRAQMRARLRSAA